MLYQGAIISAWYLSLWRTISEYDSGSYYIESGALPMRILGDIRIPQSLSEGVALLDEAFLLVNIED